jgi:hypothetical protein
MRPLAENSLTRNFPQGVIGTDLHDRFDRCRDSVAWIGFTTYKNAGTAKLRASRTRLHELWVGLWVGKFAAEAAALLL